MKIGINIGCFGPLSADTQIGLMKDNGFETTFAMSDMSELPVFAEKAAKAGIVFEFLHAPFKGVNAMWNAEEEGETFLAGQFAAIDTCAALGIGKLVVHLSSGPIEKQPRVNDLGFSRFVRLMEYAEKKNTVICYENQRMLANIALAFEQFPAARFCYDLGHESCFSPGMQFMPLFGKKLSVLHIHDNRGYYNKDDHMLPFDGGGVNFERCAAQIAQSGFTGSAMLEVIRSHAEWLYGLTDAQTYYRRAAIQARRFVSMIDACR